MKLFLFFCFILFTSSHLGQTSLLKRRKLQQKTGVVLFVGSIDGKLTAFDVENKGRILWTQTNQDALFYSSTPQLVYNESGKSVRAIPSLTQGLFTCKGNVLIPLPVNRAQKIWRLTKKTALVVSEKTNVAIREALTGKELSYFRCLGYCMTRKMRAGIMSSTMTNKTVLVETRITQTVRKLKNIQTDIGDPWSYSATMIDLQLFNGYDFSLGGQTKSASHDKCLYKFDTKSGTVMFASHAESELSAWKHHLASPIAYAWLLLNGRLHSVDLFSACHVPELENLYTDTVAHYFLGVYNKQTYLQAFRYRGMMQPPPTVRSERIQEVFDSRLRNYCACISILAENDSSYFRDTRFDISPSKQFLSYLQINQYTEAKFASNICNSDFQQSFYAVNNLAICDRFKMEDNNAMCPNAIFKDYDNNLITNNLSTNDNELSSARSNHTSDVRALVLALALFFLLNFGGI